MCTSYGVGVPGQLFQMRGSLAAHGVGLQRQHDAKLRQQPTQPIDGGRARLDEPLARTVHHQLLLLLFGLHRHEQHVWPRHRLANGRRIRSVVLAAPPGAPVRRHELRRHQPHRVAELGELPRPVVRARTRLHPDQARRQRGDQLHKLRSRHRRLQQHRLALLVASVHSKHVLGQINSNGQNGHGLPLSTRLMRFATPIAMPLS
jgi:hypothetical protein